MIKVNSADGVAHVTLERPEQRNAMSADLVADLIAAFERLSADDGVGAVVLSGAGRGFCAGSDLAGLARMSPVERSVFEADSGRVARMIGRLAVPVVAGVKGFAIGGGLTLAVGCDIVVTDPAAKWSLPEAPIGLFPAWGLGLVVERIGAPAARRLSWGIDTLSGEEAVRLGLADQLAEDPVAEALSIAARLASLPRAQARAVKTYFSSPQRGEEADWTANRLFMEMTETPEAKASFRKYGKLEA